MNLDELEREINAMVAKHLASKLDKASISRLEISPFKIKERSGKVGRGLSLSGGINQEQQLHDKESWLGPGNFVLNWM